MGQLGSEPDSINQGREDPDPGDGSHPPSFHNFASYYAVAMFFKEPIALHILGALGLGLDLEEAQLSRVS
jgi:hypothetical protein